MSSSEQTDLEMAGDIFLIKLRDFQSFFQSFYHVLLYIFAISSISSVVLALVCLFADLLVVEEDPYRILLCFAWATSLLYGIILDVLGSFIKEGGKEMGKRLFCHVLSCVTALYLSTKIFHIAPGALPQWLPAIITFAVGVGLGARSLSSKEQLWGYFSKLFGCQPVMLASEDR